MVFSFLERNNIDDIAVTERKFISLFNNLNILSFQVYYFRVIREDKSVIFEKIENVQQLDLVVRKNSIDLTKQYITSLYDIVNYQQMCLF